MRFRNFLKLNEAIWSGNLKYSLPKDKEQQLYDFYMFTLLTKTPNDEANYVIEEISNELLLPLKKNLKDAVLFAVCAEIRHVYDKINTQDQVKELAETIEKSGYHGERYKDIFIKYTQQYYAKSSLGMSFIDKLERKRNNKRLEGGQSSYRESYNAMTKATDNHTDIIKLCEFLYEQPIWNNSYGGKAWANICRGWLRLDKAKSKGDLMVAIDHVYDLQHNTDTVFNKLRNYYKEGYSWIKKALDFKRDIRSGTDLLDKVSPEMKRISLRILKLNGVQKEKEKEKEEKEKEEKNDELRFKKIPDPVIHSDGTKEWYKDGKLHSYNDQPAAIEANGEMYWYKDGNLHRDNDQPAVIYPDGTKIWYKDGVQYKPNEEDANISKKPITLNPSFTDYLLNWKFKLGEFSSNWKLVLKSYQNTYNLNFGELRKEFDETLNDLKDTAPAFPLHNDLINKLYKDFSNNLIGSYEYKMVDGFNWNQDSFCYIIIDETLKNIGYVIRINFSKDFYKDLLSIAKGEKQLDYGFHSSDKLSAVKFLKDNSFGYISLLECKNFVESLLEPKKDSGKLIEYMNTQGDYEISWITAIKNYQIKNNLSKEALQQEFLDLIQYCKIYGPGKSNLLIKLFNQHKKGLIVANKENVSIGFNFPSGYMISSNSLQTLDSKEIVYFYVYKDHILTLLDLMIVVNFTKKFHEFLVKTIKENGVIDAVKFIRAESNSIVNLSDCKKMIDKIKAGFVKII